MRRRLLAVLAVLTALSLPFAAAAQELTVFAAASLQNALEDIGKLHAAAGGAPVRFSFAGSARWRARSSRAHRPAMFASADEQWMDYLQQRQLIATDIAQEPARQPAGADRAGGQPATVDLKPRLRLRGAARRDGRWRHRRSEQRAGGALCAGRHEERSASGRSRRRAWCAPRTCASALAFVERGEAAAGVVYETDAALSKKVRIAGVFPADSHTAVSYPVRCDRQARRSGGARLPALPRSGPEVFAYGFTVRSRSAPGSVRAIGPNAGSLPLR